MLSLNKEIKWFSTNGIPINHISLSPPPTFAVISMARYGKHLSRIILSANNMVYIYRVM